MGNWIMESHNVSVKTIYFNETIDQWKHTLSDSTDTSLTIPQKRAQLRENGIPEWHLYPELHAFTFNDQVVDDVTMYRESANNRDIKVTAKHADDTAKGLVLIDFPSGDDVLLKGTQANQHFGMRIAVSSDGAIVTVADANNDVFIYKITQASGSGVNTAVKVGTIDLSLDDGINIAQLAVYHRQDYAFIALSYNILPTATWPADNKLPTYPSDTLFYQCKYELYSFTATDDSNNLNFSQTETASAAYTDTVVANVYTSRTVKLLWEPFQSIAIVNDGSVVIWANNRNVRVFDASDNTLIKELDHRFASVAVSNNMQYIAIGSWGSQLILDDRCINYDITLSVSYKKVLIYQLSSIRDSDQPAPIDTFNVDERPRSLTFSDDDNRLVIGMITKFEVWGNNFSAQTPNSLAWGKHSELSIPDIALTDNPPADIYNEAEPMLAWNNWILKEHVNAPGVYLTVVNQTDDIIGTLGHHNSLGGEKTRSYIADTPVHDENKYKTISYNLVKDYEEDTETTLINYFKTADSFNANDLHYPALYIIDKYGKTIYNLIDYGYVTETDFPYNIVKDYGATLQNGIMTLFSAIRFDVKALGYPVLYIIEKLIYQHGLNLDDFLAYGYEVTELQYNNVKDYDSTLQNIIMNIFSANPLNLKVLGYPVNYLIDKNFTAGALESRYGYEAADLLVQLTTSEKVTLRYTNEEYTAQYFKKNDVALDTVVMFQFTPGELFEAGYKMSDFIVRPSHKELLQYGFTLKDIYPDLIDSLGWETIDTSISDISISNPELDLTGHALAAHKQSIATIHERATVGTYVTNNNLYERNPNDIPMRVAVFDINDDRSALKLRGNVIEVKVGTSFIDGDETYDTAYASSAMTGNIVISADGNIIAFATDYTKWDEGSLTSYGDIINVIHTYKYNEQNNTWNHHGNIIRSSNYTSMVMSALGDTIVLGILLALLYLYINTMAHRHGLKLLL
jgi:hypothetical protein